MKDWLYYPLFAVVAGAMVWFAYNYGEREEIDPSQGFVIDGTLLQMLTASPGTSLTLKGDGINPISSAVMGADFKSNVQPSPGVFAVLGPEYSKAYAGKDLVLTVRARAAAEKPSEKFMIGFFPYTTGRVRWQTFKPTPDYNDFTIETTLGPYNAEQPEIYFGVWPDKDGERRSIEVQRYEVRISE